MTNLLFRNIFIASATLLFAGCTTGGKSPPAALTKVDLDRYMGRWYVISNIPYFLERDKVASYDTYERRPDGKLTNNFTFRKKTIDGPEKTWEGVARIIDPVSNATWKVSFVWPISVTYKIFALDPDYRWAAVGTNKGDLLWVLARERQLPAETYAAILNELKALGLPSDKLQFVPQPKG